MGFDKDVPTLLALLAACLMYKVRDRTATAAEPTLFEAFTKEATTPRLSSSMATDCINEAIALFEKSTGLMSPDDSILPDYLSGLAHAYYTRFERDGHLPDLQEALTTGRRAIQLTPDWHASKSTYKENLSQYLHSLYHHTESDEDRAEMLKASEDALASAWTTPQAELQAAVWLARRNVDKTTALSAYGAAMGALALMVGLDQTVAQRYSSIKGLSEVPIEAAAFACHFGHVDKAVEWLEQGRCLVWGQLNVLRTPIETLREYNPELASDIADVSRRLEAAGSTRRLVGDHMPQSQKLSLDDEAHGHKKLARQWEGLLKKARSIPGFEGFLKPVPCSALIDHLPSSGSTVIITAYEKGCNAIALIAGLGEPLRIPLPDLTIEKAKDYRAILNKKLRSGLRSRAEREPKDDEDGAEERGLTRYRRGGEKGALHVLKALWVEVVKPVLDALAIAVSYLHVL